MTSSRHGGGTTGSTTGAGGAGLPSHHPTPPLSIYNNNQLFSQHDTRTIAHSYNTNNTLPFRNDQYQVLIKNLFDQLCLLNTQDYLRIEDYNNNTYNKIKIIQNQQNK
eukprot:UN10241